MSDTKEYIDSLVADPGTVLYALQPARNRDGSRILEIDDQGNQKEICRYETLKEGQEVMYAYRESLAYIKH